MWKPQRHEEHEEMPPETEALAQRVIGAAISIHRALGPGFLESTYEKALSVELDHLGVAHCCQVPVAVTYRGVDVGTGVVDMLVEERIIVELKAVSELTKVHQAQVLAYLKATHLRLGLLMNFHTAVLKEGIRRVVL